MGRSTLSAAASKAGGLVARGSNSHDGTMRSPAQQKKGNWLASTLCVRACVVISPNASDDSFKPPCMPYPFINETAANTRRFSRAATHSPNSSCLLLGPRKVVPSSDGFASRACLLSGHPAMPLRSLVRAGCQVQKGTSSQPRPGLCCSCSVRAFSSQVSPDLAICPVTSAHPACTA